MQKQAVSKASVGHIVVKVQRAVHGVLQQNRDQKAVFMQHVHEIHSAIHAGAALVNVAHRT